MPRVLVAGCGYVGAATADLLHESDWTVEGWTSSVESAAAQAAKSYPVRAVDLTNATAVAKAASDVDVVIQCASSRGGSADDYRRIYLEAARHLQAAFPRARIIFASSTSVYAQSDGEWVTEESAAEPEHESGRILRETEEFVLANGGIVARLAGIYGPGRSALLRKFLDGTAVIDSASKRFVNQAHRDDIAAALFLLAARSRVELPLPRVFNVSDNHPVSRRECFEWLATRLLRPVLPVRPDDSRRRRGNSNKRVSSARLQALGWAPRYPTFQAAMEESILPEAQL